MSRSYRHNPCVGDSGPHYRKYAKRLANKKVRKLHDVPYGKVYKKYFCSYDIVDYKSYCTLGEWLFLANRYVPHYAYRYDENNETWIKVVNECSEAWVKRNQEYYTEVNWRKCYYWK